VGKKLFFLPKNRSQIEWGRTKEEETGEKKRLLDSGGEEIRCKCDPKQLFAPKHDEIGAAKHLRFASPSFAFQKKANWVGLS